MISAESSDLLDKSLNLVELEDLCRTVSMWLSNKMLILKNESPSKLSSARTFSNEIFEQLVPEMFTYGTVLAITYAGSIANPENKTS